MEDEISILSRTLTWIFWEKSRNILVTLFSGKIETAWNITRMIHRLALNPVDFSILKRNKLWHREWRGSCTRPLCFINTILKEKVKDDGNIYHFSMLKLNIDNHSRLYQFLSRAPFIWEVDVFWQTEISFFNTTTCDEATWPETRRSGRTFSFFSPIFHNWHTRAPIHVWIILKNYRGVSMK